MKSSDFLADIYPYLHDPALFPAGATVIVGLSGGPDSVFLTYLLAQMHAKGTIKLIAAHLNHEWRADAAQDEEFCRQLAFGLGIGYESAMISKLNNNFSFNGSHEEVGRKARRFFFELLARQHRAQRIALAHHADDQHETFFIRLVRGTTLTGLTGMKMLHGLYVRPLLHTRKQDILAYLHAHAIAYRTDATNIDTSFLRNNLRMTVLPALHQCDRRFARNFQRTLSSLQRTEDFLDRLAHEALQKILCPNESSGNSINFRLLLEYDPVVRDRVILLWLKSNNASHVPQESLINEIIRFLEHPRGGEHRMHAHWSIIKKHTKAYIQLST